VCLSLMFRIVRSVQEKHGLLKRWQPSQISIQLYQLCQEIVERIIGCSMLQMAMVRLRVQLLNLLRKQPLLEKGANTQNNTLLLRSDGLTPKNIILIFYSMNVKPSFTFIIFINFNV